MWVAKPTVGKRGGGGGGGEALLLFEPKLFAIYFSDHAKNLCARATFCSVGPRCIWQVTAWLWASEAVREERRRRRGGRCLCEHKVQRVYPRKGRVRKKQGLMRCLITDRRTGTSPPGCMLYVSKFTNYTFVVLPSTTIHVPSPLCP